MTDFNENFPADKSSSEQRSTKDIIDGMPTPTTTGGIFALFAALELDSMERGTSTREESAEVLGIVFSGDQLIDLSADLQDFEEPLPQAPQAE